MEKRKADYIVRAEYLLPMSEGLPVIEDGAVAVSGSRVVDVGSYNKINSLYSADIVIGGKGRALIPGLVNTHTHAAMVYFRGLADDLPLKEWLEGHIWPAESRWLSHDFVYDATILACLEMLKAGVTLYNDMYFFGDAIASATKDLGMRAVIGVGILDFPTVAAKTTDEYFEKAMDFIERWKDDRLIRPSLAPHALYTCSTDTLLRAKELSDRYNVSLHIHLSETEWEVREIRNRHGRLPAHYLESIGFLNESVIAAHCVWLDDSEIDTLARNRVSVSHCLESNLKLASGIAPITKMLKAGVRVTFGTDGAASNNDLDVLSEASTAAKLHKAISKDPTVLNSKTALLMATRWGAEALGLGNITGSIEPGKEADMVILNLEKPHLIPLYDIYSHIIYSARSSDVETVIIGGKIVLNDGLLKSQDEAVILEKAKEWGRRIRDCEGSCLAS
ncbi:MAG: amidohydrolase family protein [Thermodesulfovibrionales bacterium]